MKKRILNLFFFLSFFLLLNSTRIFSQVDQTLYLRLTSPNGGEKWEANSTQTITWQSNGVVQVKIEYSLSGGMGWHTVISSVDASLGQYSWFVPDVQIAEVLIKISDVSNTSVFDVSDNLFSIHEQSSINKLMNKQTSVLSGTPLKIMPLGDSITEGAGDDTNYVGYRAELWHLLYTAGYNFTFVGTQMSGTSSYSGEGFDNHHEGHGGMEVGPPSYMSYTTMLDNIDSYLSSNMPDIVLFHMGTNDIDNTPNDENTIASQLYEVCTNHILDATVGNPNAEIFLAKIIANYYSYPTYYNATTTLNTDIGNDYNNTSILPSAKKKNIQLVDMQSSPKLVYPNDFSSSGGGYSVLHPLSSGYVKMAQHWFNALQAYYQPKLTASVASPNDGATIQPFNLTITWNEPMAASNMTVVYDLQVSDVSDFSNIVFENSNISSNSYSFSSSDGLKFGTTYYWRVRITNYGWSDVWSFTTEPLTASVKIFLQGPYIGNSTMSTSLNSKGLIPLSQPYNNPPWNYSGTENVNQIPSGVVDWILLKLKENDSTSIKTRAAFLKSDGNVVDLDGTSPVTFNDILPGNYYIAVKHRNHLPVMSSGPVELINGTITFDFTTDSSKYYGGYFGSKLLETTPIKIWGMIAGDGNSDGLVNAEDLNLTWRPENGLDQYLKGDYNLDGYVNAIDKNLFWRSNDGKNSQTQ